MIAITIIPEGYSTYKLNPS